MKNLLSNKHVIHSLSLYSGIVVLLIIFNSTAVSIYENWLAEGDLYSHGFLLVPVSIYLFTLEWKLIINNSRIKLRIIPTIILILLSLFWYISTSVNIQVIAQFLLIAILAFYIYSLLGFKQSLRLSFPIWIFLSTVPLWVIFSEPLQVPTALIVDKALKLTGYTSFREGFYIHIPEGIFEVGDTCSGIRFQIAAITTALLYVFYYRHTLKTSFIYIAIASIVAFLSNSVRIYIIVLSGHYTNMTHSLLSDHIWLGWLVFGIFFIIYLIILGRVDSNILPAAATDKIQTQTDTSNSEVITLTKTSALALLLILISGAGPLLRMSAQFSEDPINNSALEFNQTIHGWSQVDSTSQWSPIWQSSDSELLTTFSNKLGTVDLFISTFFSQSQGKELVNDLNLPYNSDWKFVAVDTIDTSLSADENLRVTETIVTNKYGHKRIIWNWYYINGNTTNDKLKAKLLGLLNIMTGRKDETVFVVSSDQRIDIENTRNILNQFVEDSFFHFKKQLDEIGKNL
ncbi:MAG: exosortase C-terminal domain/associated protein EpsI [Candidatus Thiodiazotropha sp.]